MVKSQVILIAAGLAVVLGYPAEEIIIRGSKRIPAPVREPSATPAASQSFTSDDVPALRRLRTSGRYPSPAPSHASFESSANDEPAHVPAHVVAHFHQAPGADRYQGSAAQYRTAAVHPFAQQASGPLLGVKYSSAPEVSHMVFDGFGIKYEY